MSRQYCHNCYKAKSTCICKWVQVQSSSVPIIVLRHTDEIKKTLGTARLVELGLENAKVLSNTIFTESDCLGALSAFEASKPMLISVSYTHLTLPTKA